MNGPRQILFAPNDFRRRTCVYIHPFTTLPNLCVLFLAYLNNLSKNHRPSPQVLSSAVVVTFIRHYLTWVFSSHTPGSLYPSLLPTNQPTYRSQLSNLYPFQSLSLFHTPFLSSSYGSILSPASHLFTTFFLTIQLLSCTLAQFQPRINQSRPSNPLVPSYFLISPVPTSV